jgi:ligand-binding sensor domain-containing protein/AraC-like DNA-binding protein
MHEQVSRSSGKNPGSFVSFVILVVSLLSTIPAHGQGRSWMDYKHPIKFGMLSVTDGLSQSSVLCILQDSKGFMWFGTEDGLNRYDGYGFKIFRPERGNPHSISNNIIPWIYQDSKEQLWIATNGGGLNRYDHHMERFIHYRYSPDNPNSLSSDSLSYIYEDSSGTLWVGTGDGGLNKVVPAETGTALSFVNFRSDPDNPHSLGSNIIFTIFEDRKKVLWIGTDGGGLNRMDAGKNKDSAPSFTRFTENPAKTETFGLDHVTAINEDRYGTLWIGTQNGLLEYNRENETFKRYKAVSGNNSTISHNYIRRIYKDRAGILWIATDGGGINKMIPGEQPGSAPTFVHFRHDPNNPHGLNNNAVESVFEDLSGVLWIGLYRGGLNKLLLTDQKGHEREKQQFIHYRTIPNNDNSLSHNAVNAICEDRQGILWVGSDGGGLDKILPPDKKEDPLRFIHFRNDPRSPHSLSDNIVTSIREDYQGALWIGTYTGGLNRLEPGSVPAFTHYRYDPSDSQSLGSNFVMTIYEDHNKNLWIGTIGGGMNLFKPETGSFNRYQYTAGNNSGLSDNNVYTICEDRSGYLWIGTVSGLNRSSLPLSRTQDPLSGGFIRFRNVPGNTGSLSHNFVRVIYEDRSGTLWIGTNGGGLDKLIPGSSTGSPLAFRNYNKSSGLPNNVIVGILQDDNGHLWISTKKGISRFDPGTGSFKNYDMQDGLQSDEFNRGACFKSRSGEMFFGGNNGFNIFHPLQVKGSASIPPIVITGIQLFNQPVPIGELEDGRTLLKRTVAETREITLSHKDYVFSIQFAALHYNNPSRNRFAYIMEGLEDRWNHVGSRHFATYTTLPHGEYVFRIKGCNNDGVWNEEGVSLRITVTPPFWKTWWFSGLMALLVILTGLGIHLYRVRQIIRRMHKKYEKTHISDEKADAYLKILLSYMKMAKPYLDPELNVHKLSKLVTIPNHYLSQIINNKLNKIFFDFINQYRIEEAIKKLTDAGEKSKTIHQVAHEVGFNSQSAFNRAFKKFTEKTPSEFIFRHRIEEAARRLADNCETHKSIPQIAEEVGFNSLSTFNRAFKKVFNHTPSQYRKLKCE